MHWRNTASRYGLAPSLLHWIIVASVIAEYFIAEAGEDAEGLMGLHMSIGLAIFVLATLRLAWRLLDVRPAWPATMGPRQVLVARIVHGAFYALLFALPVTGWLLASAEGESASFFGLFTLPAAPAADEELLEATHETMFNILVALALLHVAAALKHHFIDRDGVLKGMLPRP
jgi:cytochrome b561